VISRDREYKAFRESQTPSRAADRDQVIETTLQKNGWKCFMKSQPSITPEPFALAGPLPPGAIVLWEWKYTASGIAASGTLTSSSSLDASGHFLISGIAGSRNGDPITALEPAGQAIPGNEGFPVDDLIGPGGSLTGNGIGYETASGNFANPFFADFLTPPTFREVISKPAFNEVSIQFQAHRVPGVTLATAAPAAPGDKLSLDVIHAPRSGILSLLGTSVQYFPLGKNSHTPVTFSFDLKDQNGATTPVISVIAAGNGSHTLTGAASGYTDISLGKGNNIITLSGGNNTVTLGSGSDTVYGGNGDTISIAGDTRLAIHGTNEMVFVGAGNVAIDDLSTGLKVSIGPTIGHAVISGFTSDPNSVVDLTGGLGGFTDTAMVLSALKSDGRGGTLLSFGQGHFINFAGVTPAQLHATNFDIR
jgi:hypothetical protein